MSARNKSDFEALPIEIIHRIFNHLDSETILFSIRCTSKQLYYAANTYNRYELDFRYMFQSDLVIIGRIINPENIVSITLSDELHTRDQIKLFFSHFRIDQFTRLHSLNLTYVNGSDLNKFKNHVMQCSLKTFSISLNGLYLNTNSSAMSSILSHHSLQKFEFEGCSDMIKELKWPTQCYLKHVTIYECGWETLYNIISHLPYAQTLVIKYFRNFSFKDAAVTNNSNTHLTVNLTSLLLNHCSGIKMNDVETLLSRLPALKYLRLLSPSDERDSGLFDGSRWENLIRTRLLLLNKFEFSFKVSKRFNSNGVTIESLIAPFRTPFWLENKNWFIKCDLEKDILDEVFRLYSIPLFTAYVTYPEYRDTIRYSTSNIADNSTTIIVNTCELYLELDTMTFNNENCSIPNYFFQNVTKLYLSIKRRWSRDLMEHLLTIVNLSCLEKLTLILCSESAIGSFHEGAKILFSQTSNLRSITLMCHYNTVGKLFLNDILPNLPYHVKHLETNISDPEHATMILEKAEYLSIVKFEVFAGEEFWSHITRWLSRSGRKATIQKESKPHHCATSPPIRHMYLWFKKRINK